MANDVGQQLLQSLKDVDWQVAARVYGNDHSTLIGLIVRWWVSQCPERRWAMDGGATCRPQPKARPWHCDALLGEDNAPVGILEVEGAGPEHALERVKLFLNPRQPEDKRLLGPLRFAILVVYPTGPKGHKEQKHFPSAFGGKLDEKLRRLSKQLRGRQVVVVAIEKGYEHELTDVRGRTEYHRGSANHVSGRLYQGGRVVGPIRYWPAQETA